MAGQGTPPVLGTNVRMFAITPTAAAAWRGIFGWLAGKTGLPLAPLDHPPPAPLATLWSQPSLGCVAMCGWPFAEAQPRPQLLAAPVPSPEWFEGRPEYWSNFVVRTDSPYRRIEDTFGGAIGWTVQDSHSGFNMPRFHLLRHRSRPEQRLYARSVGGLINPLGALTAVAEGLVDVAPVDSFCHDILKASAHPVTQVTRTIDRTEASPIPVLIASADIPTEITAALTQALLQAHLDPEVAPFLRSALIGRFVRPDEATYGRGHVLDRAAAEAHYEMPA